MIEDRIQRLRELPAYRVQMDRHVSESRPTITFLAKILLGVVLISYGALFFRWTRHKDESYSLYILCPALVCLGGWMILRYIGKWVRYEHVPGQAFGAIITNKKCEEVSEDTSRYTLDLVSEFGGGHSFEVTKSFYDQVTINDAGVAHVRDTFLLNFTKVDV